MTTVLPEVTPVAEWRRLSPRMLLVHPVVELGRALPALIGLLIAGTSSGSGSRWSLLGAGVVILAAISRWFTTRFRITTAQIQLRHGLLRRKTVAAPLDRVRTVDVTAHLLHRVLGLAKVVIGTGTSDRKGRGGLTLDGLDSAEANALREELLHWRTGARPEEITSAAVEDEIAVLDRHWIHFAPYTLSGALTGLAVLGFGWRIVSEGHVKLDRIGPFRTAGHWLERHNDLVDIGLIAVLAIAFVAIASTVGYVLAFWNFRLTRHSGGTLHVTRGLLTTRATSIERTRLAGVELSEPLLLRAAGGARCLAIATGLRVGRGAERGGELLLPPAPTATAITVVQAVLDDAAPFLVALTPHPVAARHRRLLRAGVGAVLAVALVAAAWTLFGLHGYGWLVAAVLIPLAVPLGLDRYRSLGHALTDAYLVTRFGSLVRRRCALSRGSVIGWNLRTTFFQRRVGLSTLTATTAAGRQRYRISDLDSGASVALADAAVPGLLHEFLA
jgi:putative membrane protein